MRRIHPVLNEMSTKPEICEVEPDGRLLDDVIRLGNGPAKRTLGLLPDQGFADRARKGTLLAALIDGELVGYVLYDLPRNEAKIVHLCVAPAGQRRGIARSLVDEVASRHSDRQRLVLWCRDDYDAATAVWKALGFLPLGSKPGRSKAGHMLTIWERNFGNPTLFDVLEGERARAALDHNVFLDLHLPQVRRPEGKESEYLLTDWIAEYIELCVTDEIFHEIHDHKDAKEKSTEQGWASQYRNISNPADAWEPLVAIVAELAPKADPADHRHVARAAAAGAAYLVSRDGDLLDSSDAIESGLDIAVLPPERLIARLDRMRSDDPYRPVALQGTELSQFVPPDDLHAEFMSSLLNHASGEKRAELGARLRPALADRSTYDIQIVQTRDGRTIGGFARRVAGDQLDVPFLRVAPGWVGAHVVARQLAFAQRKHAADSGLGEVKVTDPHPSRDIRDALKLEYFRQGNAEWVCDVRTGLLDVTEGASARSLSANEAFDLENREWPVKIIGAEIPTYLVPIKLPFAEALLDPELAGGSLIPRRMGLGLNREHVYYRRVQNARGIAPGARILWYVSGDSRLRSRGSVCAVSQAAEVVVERPRSLFARFERFGVYGFEQVRELADGKGQVMAIRFTNTELLDRPLNLDELTRLWEQNGDRFHAPRCPTAISEHMFCRLYEQSSRYAD
jgi:ribosomal protein S18 acetylase RimI-like enzyme/predicted nucleic acid-binding protein